MISNFVTTFLLIIAVIIFAYLKKSKDLKLNNDYRYFYPEEKLLNNAELSFFKTLNTIIENSNYIVFSKVRMEDVVYIDKTLNFKKKQIVRNKIKARHLDFLICDSETTKILCAIELDDKSHNNPKNAKNDIIKNDIMKQAGIELYRIKAQKSYSIQEIKDILFYS